MQILCQFSLPHAGNIQIQIDVFYLELELTAPARPGTPLRTQRGPATLELLYRSVALAVTHGFSSSLAVALPLSAPSTTALTWRHRFRPFYTPKHGEFGEEEI